MPSGQAVARSLTIRFAEDLAKYLSRLMRNAEDLATPHTQCLLYATYWFRPILSELLGAAKETNAGIKLSLSPLRCSSLNQ